MCAIALVILNLTHALVSHRSWNNLRFYQHSRHNQNKQGLEKDGAIEDQKGALDPDPEEDVEKKVEGRCE